MLSKWQVGLALVLVAVIGSTGLAEDKKLVLEGSTTVGPIADGFAEAFKKLHPDVSITINKTGSGDGAAALVDDRCDIANMSRFMKPKEFKSAVSRDIFPVAHVVAMDGVAVSVHPSNPVKGLKVKQVRDIYSGKITNWKQLGGPDKEIVVISRDTNSGTYETFHKLVMGKDTKMKGGTEYVNSNPAMHARISKTPNAIGYLGLGFLDDKVKALEVDKVLPNNKTVASGVYPVSRPLFMFTNGFPKLGSIIHAFVTFHLTEDGQDIVLKKGFVPVTNY